VSGGADSLALLVLGVHAGCAVHAIHVDHGLRSGSAAEAEVVAAAAERFGARFSALSVQVGVGPNLEERARQARYGALPRPVCTGHTADDQAETILMALLRGSGPAGMGAMSPSVQRPLLGLRRHETEAVCRAFGLEPVFDPSNHDPRHRRNRIRHEVLPLLADVADRDLVPVLVRQGELFRDTAEVLVRAAESVDPSDAAALRSAPRAVAREAIRTWIRDAWSSPHPPDLAAVDRVLAVAALDIRATDVGSGWRVERTAGRLRLVAPAGGSRPPG
jgi:tRNA(Ile)-lysidine synthase